MNFKEGSKSFLFLASAFFAGVSLLLSAVVFYGSRNVQAAAATCYWVGDTSPANWNDATHWSSSAGGPGSTCDGGVVPGSDDSVFFTSDNTNNVTIDAGVSVSSWTNSAGYTGTINHANDTNTVTVSGSMVLNAGSYTMADQGTFRTKMTLGGLSLGGGTLTVGDFATVNLNGTFAETSGSLTVKTNSTMNITGDFTYSGGTYTNNGSSTRGVIFTGNSSNVTPAPAMGVFRLAKTAGQTLTVLGNISATSFIVSSGNIETSGYTITLTYDSGALNCNGQTVDNVTIAANPAYSNNSCTIDGTLTINTGKALTMQGGGTITLSDTGRLVLNGTGSIGSYYINPGVLALVDDAANNIPATGGTLGGKIQVISSTKDITIPGRNYIGRLDLINSSGTNRTITMGSAASQTFNIGGSGYDNYYTSGLFIAANGNGNLTVDASINNPTVNLLTYLATYTVGHIDFTGTGAGVEELKAGSGTWSLKGNMDLTGGSLLAGTSTFNFNGTSSQTQTLTSAGQSFYNLTIANTNTTGFAFADAATITGTLRDTTATSKVTFNAGSTYTVANINIVGTSGAGNTVTLKSSSAGVPWLFNVSQVSPTVSYVTVSDSNATGGNDVIAYDGTNVDGTGNTGWLFVAVTKTVSGTVYTAEDELSNIGSNKTIALSINGAASTTVETSSGGVFEFTNTGLDEGESLVLYIDDETEKGSYIGIATSLPGDATGIKIFTNRISLDHFGGASITNADIASADVVDTDSLFNASLGSVTFTDGYELWVPTDRTYAPAGAVQVDDVEVEGTYILSSNTMTINGSLIGSSGALSFGSGTVDFNSASSENVSIGSNTLGTVQFTNSGSWSFGASIQTGIMTLAEGSIIFGDNGYSLTATTLELTGGAITVETQSIPRTKISVGGFTNNGGTFALGGFAYIDVTGAFVSSSGSTTFNTFSRANIGGDFTVSGGAYSDSGSTIYLQGSQSSALIDAPASFASTLVVAKEDGYTLTLQDDITLNNASMTISSTGSFNSNGRIITFTGVDSKNFSPNGKTINNLVISGGGGVVYLLSDLTITDSLNIATGATLSQKSDADLTLTNNCSTTLVGSLSAHYLSPGYITLIDDAGTNFPTTGTLAGKIRFHASTKNVSIPARTYFGRVEAYNSGSTSRTVTLGTANNQTITIGGHGYDNYYESGLFLYADGTGDTTVDAATYNPNVIVTSYEVLNNGDIDFVGTGGGTEVIKAGSGTWSVKGDIDFTGGTFTAGSSTVVLNGSGSQTQNITSASQPFNNLTVNNNSSTGVIFKDSLTVANLLSDKTVGSKVTFNAGSTYTTGSLEMQGSGAGRVSLRSSSPGTSWYLSVTNPPTVYYVDVMDSDASSGGQITANDQTSVDSGNNLNWNFTVPSTPTPTPTSTQTSAPTSEPTRTEVPPESVSTATKTATRTATVVASATPESSTTIGGLDLPLIGSSVVVNVEDPVIQGKTEPFAIVYIKINGDSSLSEVVVADENGNWSYTPTGIKKGDYSLQIQIKDAQGNTIEEKSYELKVQGTSESNSLRNSKTIYIIISVIVLIFLVLFLIFIISRKKEKKQKKRIKLILRG